MSEAKIVAIKSSDLIAIGVCYTFALCWAFFGLCFGRAVEVLGAVCVAEMVGAVVRSKRWTRWKYLDA